LVAAIVLAKSSLLIRRFAFGALAGAGGLDSPRILVESPLLSFLHALFGGSGESLSFTCGSFRRGGGLSVTRQLARSTMFCLHR
jgi:hypothetical protein